jgi:hypothetical protein
VCTLTVVPQPRGRYRVAFNRDEARDRPPALPPQRRRFGDRNAILPVDPVSGGTWLAVNDAGLLFALTNRNPPSSVPSPDRSRGEIILSLLDGGTGAEVARRLGQLEVERYAPFRLLVLAGPGLTVLTWDGATRRDELVARVTRPLVFTSSGLGDHLVEGPRVELFEGLVVQARSREAGQDVYHRHVWPDRPHLSVNMSRADARTVSHTLVELSPHEAMMTYLPDAPSAEFDTVEIAMARLLISRPDH